MRLSVCCFTKGPAQLVAGQLALLRPVAGEIVVAIDDRADEEVDRACRRVADVVVRRRWLDPLERSLAWLHEQCSGEWILRVDTDEIASRLLVAELPRLSEPDVTHYWIPRRLLFPDVGHYVAQAPWYPDLQLRLVRNEPDLLRFSGDVHSSVEPAGPGGRTRGSLYHAESLLLSAAARRRKGVRYAALAGVPASDARVLLPENVPDLRVREVPARDQRVLKPMLLGAT